MNRYARRAAQVPEYQFRRQLRAKTFRSRRYHVLLRAAYRTQRRLPKVFFAEHYVHIPPFIQRRYDI